MKPLRGEVVSVKMAKTAVVWVRESKKHPLYRKRITRIKKFHVHDELGVNPGDWVEFMPSRPVSKTKKWVITKALGSKK